MKLKIVLLGPMAVGKTSVCNRLKYKTFDQNYQVTIGAGLLEYNVKVDGINIEAQIWDTAGMERHRTLSPIYFRDSNIAFFVYDVSESSSVSQLDSYFEEFRESNNRSYYGILCGNKIDLLHNSEAIEAGEKWAKAHEFDFAAVSAKTGEGVEEVFLKAIRGAMLLMQGENENGDNSSLIKNEKKGCSC